MKRPQVPTELDDDFEEFVTKIVTDREPLILILRGHLITELLINDLFQTFESLGASEDELLGATSGRYLEKVEALNKGGLIPARIYAPLVTLNRIRNNFSHLPIKLDVTEADEKVLLDAFAEDDRRNVEKQAETFAAVEEHSILRSSITNLYVMLSVLVLNFRKSGPARYPDSMLSPLKRHRKKGS